MAELAPYFQQRFFNDSGEPLVGGKIYTYAAGTTTPLATYSNRAGSVANANPIILDANGECQMWLDDDLYKFVVRDSNDVVLRTIDNVGAPRAIIGNNAIATANLQDGSVTTAKVSSTLINGMTEISAPATNDYLPIADVSDSGANRKILISRLKDLNPLSVSSVTTTQTLTTAPDVVLASGGAITLTLPTAVGYGKKLTIKKTDSSLTNIITIDGDGSQTIDGALTTTLNTEGEAVTLVSDGSNWIVMDRIIPKVIYDGGAITVGATTTAPTKATTRETDKVTFTRDGKYATFIFRYYASSATGSNAGNGTYLWSLPNSLVMDTTHQPNSSGDATDTTSSMAAVIPGRLTLRSNTGPTGMFDWGIVAYNSTQFFVKYQNVGGTPSGIWGSGNFAFTAVLGFTMSVRIPISGWNG